MKNNKCIIAFCVIFLTVSLLPLQSQDAVTRAVEGMKQHLLLQEYDRAYSFAVFVIRFYRNNEMPLETLDAVERTISARSNQLMQNKEWETLLEMEKTLVDAPASVKEKAAGSINTARTTLNRIEEERLLAAALLAEKEADAAREAARRREREEAIATQAALLEERTRAEAAQREQIDRLLEESRRLELEKEKLREAERAASAARQMEIEIRRQQSDESYRKELSTLVQTINQTNTDTIRSVTGSNTAVIVGLGILTIFVIFGITTLVIVALRQQKMQHEQFQNTLKTMQAMRTAAPYDMMALPMATQDINGVRALPGSQALLLEDKNNANTQGLSEQAIIKGLLEKCLTYGQEIDKITGRRNTSKLVADLVYKMSRELGFSEQDSIIYFAVGLVYDIGFLNIDPAILRADHITEEQFTTIKTHTITGSSMVFFVDEQYRSIFKDGVCKHHENIDGTGYPNGLKGEDIPYIARALRVIESYIALISSREYKEIRDRDAALRELYSNSQHYDQDLVKVLDNIV